MSAVKLFTTEVIDRYVRSNFERLADYFRADPFRKGGFMFMEIVFTGAGFPKTLTPAHGLGFQPKDVIALSVRAPDTATVSWNYDSFTREKLSVTVSAPCTARFYVGRYEES